MALQKIKDFDPNYKETFGGNDIKGSSVYSESSDEKIGTVDDVLVDEDGQFRYMVVDLGFWIFGKKVLLPVGRSRMDQDSDRVYAIGLSKNQAEDLPEFKEDMLVDYDYEERVRGVYRSDAGMAGAGMGATSTQTTGSMPGAAATSYTADPTMSDPAVASSMTDPMMASYEASSPATTGYTADSTSGSSLEDPLTTGYASEPPLTGYTTDPMTGSTADQTLTGSVSDPTTGYAAGQTSDMAYTRDTYGYGNEPSLYQMSDADQTLRLYQERLIASKTRRKTGEVTVGKHVETETERVSVPIEKERVVIERSAPTDAGVAVPPGEATFADGEVARVEIYEETPDIHKEAFVREEISVRKEVDRDVINAEETIRREELDIDAEGRTVEERTGNRPNDLI